MNIVDPRTSESEIQDVQTLEEIKTILPYFPDDERMSRYLCYTSTGWTRKEARIRAGITYIEYKEMLKDPRFREIDELPYDEKKRQVANAYAELKVRKNTIQWIEFDEEFSPEMIRKIAEHKELTKDERAIFLKRASLYTPDTFKTANNIISDSVGDNSGGDNQGFDIAVFVRQRRGS